MGWRCVLRVALSAFVLMSVGASPGFAKTPTVPTGRTFSYTGAEQSYAVPADVTMLQAEAVGAPGQTASIQPGPGDGLDLAVGLPVIAGETLFAEVGAPGGASLFGGGGAGGTGSGAVGGAGGGASDVRTCSLGATSCAGGASSAATRLLVAGGGGGSGGAPPSSEVDLGSPCGTDTGGGSAAPAYLSDFTPIAVPGGTALPGLDDDIQTQSSAGDARATGGSGTAPGSGGTIAGCSGGNPLRTYGGSIAGSAGGGAVGGAGGSGPGGGGGGAGGGYFGGGGGPSGQTETAGPHVGNVSNGSGGAGGSSFFSSLDTGNISYQGAGSTPPEVIITPLIAIASPARNASFAQGQVVDASYACLDGCVETTVASGKPINTSKMGKHTFQVGDQAQSHPIALSTLSYTVRAAKRAIARITGAAISKHTAKFSFAARGGPVKSFRCALQRQVAGRHAAVFAKCKAPKTYRGLKPGSYIFSVRAIGVAGKPSVATHRFTIS